MVSVHICIIFYDLYELIGGELDKSPEHVIFNCPSFTWLRNELAELLSKIFYPEDIVPIMLISPNSRKL